jgi:hypothetical protein
MQYFIYNLTHHSWMKVICKHLSFIHTKHLKRHSRKDLGWWSYESILLLTISLYIYIDFPYYFHIDSCWIFETLKPIEFLVSELTAWKNSNQLDWRSCSVFFPEGKTCKLRLSHIIDGFWDPCPIFCRLIQTMESELFMTQVNRCEVWTNPIRYFSLLSNMF